jgi:hypothetical protein
MTFTDQANTRDSSAVLSSPPKSISRWVFAVVVVCAVLMAAGGVIALVNPAMLVSPHDEINGAVHIYGGYLASRNLCIAAMLLALMFTRATKPLAHLMVLTALIQLADAGFDCVEGRWPIVPGVLVLGLLLLLAAARLSPFWKAEAWK